MLCPVDSISIILADEHLQFRAAVRQALAQVPGLRVLAEAADGLQAWEAIQAHRPCVAVLDIEMPGWTGLEIARKVREQRMATAIVLLTVHSEEQIEQSAKALGVLGYVLKEHFDTELVQAIRAAAAGRAHYALKPSV